MAKKDNIEQVIDRVLFSQEEINDITIRLGKQLTNDYAGKNPVVVGALTGAIFFMTDLVRHVDVKMQLDFMDVSSYGDNLESSGKVKLVRDLTTDIKDRDVLIVEDIVDTGHTLKFMKDLLIKRGAKSVKCCVLLDKPVRREVDIKADYIGSEVGNEFVVGYGLDFMKMYRNIPFIGVMKPEVIKKYLK